MNDESALLFNDDWKFLLGDPAEAEQENYCDRTWNRVDLPHDWVIHQPFDRGENGVWTKQGMQGFFFWKNTGWYRKTFCLDEIAGKDVFLYFGCAYRNAVTYINGKKAGSHSYGYTSFELCITSHVRPGKNLVAIRLDNGASVPDRWYSGAGLFRDVYLRVVPRLHFKPWGLGVRVVIQKDNTAEIKITANLENTDHAGGSSVLNLALSDPQKNEIAVFKQKFEFTVNSQITLEHNFVIKNPQLWCSENPLLYQLSASIEDGGNNPKHKKIFFGIRTIEMIAKKGFFINGKNTKLKGVCLHHDCGILGAAFYKEAWKRKLLILKGMGCNAIRTSHNPQAEEFLDLCDELGFYVIDECFDKWKSLSYGEIFETD